MEENSTLTWTIEIKICLLSQLNMFSLKIQKKVDISSLWSTTTAQSNSTEFRGKRNPALLWVFTPSSIKYSAMKIMSQNPRLNFIMIIHSFENNLNSALKNNIKIILWFINLINLPRNVQTLRTSNLRDLGLQTKKICASWCTPIYWHVPS